MHQLTKASKWKFCCSRLQVKFCEEFEFSMWLVHIKLKSLKRNASRDGQRSHGTKQRAWSYARSNQGLPKVISNSLKAREKYRITFPSESPRPYTFTVWNVATRKKIVIEILPLSLLRVEKIIILKYACGFRDFQDPAGSLNNNYWLSTNIKSILNMFVTSLISEVYMLKTGKNENLRDKTNNFKS